MLVWPELNSRPAASQPNAQQLSHQCAVLMKVPWVLKDKEKLKVNCVIHGSADGQFDRFVDSVRIYHCLCEGQLSECLQGPNYMTNFSPVRWVVRNSLKMKVAITWRRFQTRLNFGPN